MTAFLATRIDDIPLVVGVIRALQLDTLLDDHIPTHGNTLNQNALTNGEAICLWLTFLLTQGKHQKWKVEDWVADHAPLLHRLWGAPVPASDFTDDRLTTVASRLAVPETQQRIDQALSMMTLQIYDWGQEAIRLDGTDFHGYHHIADGVMQYGFAKETVTGRAQCKLMAASTETGQYLTGQFHPGNVADDPLYLPVLQELFTWSTTPGLLFVGDSKMGALATRTGIAQHGHYYYMPLSNRGIAQRDWDVWMPAALAGTLPGFAPIWRDEELLGYGFAWTRTQQEEGGPAWTERVHLVRSLSQVAAEQKAVRRRLDKAVAALKVLTPSPKRGVTPFLEESRLQEAIQAVLTRHQVHGLLTVQYAAQPYQGRSRAAKASTASASQEPTVRYVITAVEPQPAALRELEHTFGWRIFVTNAPESRLSLAEGIRLYRRGAGQGIERMNRVLKDHETLGLDRLYVSRDDQIVGMAYLVTLALRVMMDIERKVRRGLAQEDTTLVGYSPNARMNRRPTTKTMLEQVCAAGVTWLTITEQGQTQEYLSEFPPVLVQMLRYLGLPPAIYTQLIE
jgi:transposase